MRFSKYSDEESCGKSIETEWTLARPDIGPFACLRTAGHEGECIAGASDAGRADGLRFCCRVQLGQPHTDWCVVKDMTP